MGTVGHPRGSRGSQERAGQNRFSKNLIFKRFAAKFFGRSRGGSPSVKKDSVNLTFNAFLHRKIFIYAHYRSRGDKGVVQILRFAWSYVEKF